jgi:hypothetical protein
MDHFKKRPMKRKRRGIAHANLTGAVQQQVMGRNVTLHPPKEINEHTCNFTIGRPSRGFRGHTRVVSSQCQPVDCICGGEIGTEDNIIRKNRAIPDSMSDPYNEFAVFGRARVIAGRLFVFVYLVRTFCEMTFTTRSITPHSM